MPTDRTTSLLANHFLSLPKGRLRTFIMVGLSWRVVLPHMQVKR